MAPENEAILTWATPRLTIVSPGERPSRICTRVPSDAALDGKEIKKLIVIPNRLINIIV